MAIIPQYRAKGPAAPLTPVMEQERGPRVDASEAVRGIARLTGAIESPAQVEQLNPELGQGVARGTQAIGQGITDVGSALFDISQRVAEAKNYHDEHQAQLALDREVGEFEKEKASLTDPMMWEPAWKARMERFSGQYFNGKNLAPATQEAIKMRTESFGVRFSNRVISEAEHKIAGDATGALMSDVLRATEAGELGVVKDLLTRGQNLGLIDEYRATQMEFQAQDQIETKQVESGRNQIKTFLLYNDMTGALNVVDEMPVNDDEKKLLRAEITQTHGYNITLNEIEDIIDPNERIKAIESGKYSNLRASDKERFLNGSYQQINLGNADTVEALKEAFSGGASLRDISMSDAFKSLPESSQMAFTEFAVKGAKNDISEYLTALRTVQAYDPSKDTNGAELAALRQSALLNFDSDRGQKILTTLEESSQRTTPQTAIERVESDYFSYTQNRYNNGDFGNFRVTGDQISKRTDENGVPVYTIPDPSGEFKQKEFLGTYSGRVIKLSEEDKMKYESTPNSKKGALILEDQSAKEVAFTRFNSFQNDLVQQRKDGKITNADELAAAGAALLGGEIRGAAAQKLGNQDAPTNNFGRPDGTLFTPDQSGAKTSREFEAEINAKLEEWERKAKEN
jgi:hypothetical protein